MVGSLVALDGVLGFYLKTLRGLFVTASVRWQQFDCHGAIMWLVRTSHVHARQSFTLEGSWRPVGRGDRTCDLIPTQMTLADLASIVAQLSRLHQQFASMKIGNR